MRARGLERFGARAAAYVAAIDERRRSVLWRRATATTCLGARRGRGRAKGCGRAQRETAPVTRETGEQTALLRLDTRWTGDAEGEKANRNSQKRFAVRFRCRP